MDEDERRRDRRQSPHFRVEHHQEFSRLFTEAEDAAADLFVIDGALLDGGDRTTLNDIRLALRSYRNLLLRIVGASPL